MSACQSHLQMKPIESQGVKFLFVPIFTYFLKSFLFSPIFSRKPPIFPIFWKLMLAFEKQNHSCFFNAAPVGCYKGKCYNIAWLTNKLNLESQLEIKYGTQYLWSRFVAWRFLSRVVRSELKVYGDRKVVHGRWYAVWATCEMSYFSPIFACFFLFFPIFCVQISYFSIFLSLCATWHPGITLTWSYCYGRTRISEDKSLHFFLSPAVDERV